MSQPQQAIKEWGIPGFQQQKNVEIIYVNFTKTKERKKKKSTVCGMDILDEGLLRLKHVRREQNQGYAALGSW
jgi:hypothetical protein